MAAQGGYSAHQITVIVNGVIISGFAAGDFVTADHETDDTEAFEGADGYVATADKPEFRLGTIELVLAQTSLANNELSAILAGRTLVPVQVFNPKGGELALMPQAKLKKSPPIAYGTGIKDRTWAFIGKLRKSHAGYDE